MSSSSPKKLTVKQQREVQRAEKIEAMKKKMAAEKRKHRIGIASAIVGGVAVVALVVGFIITNGTPRVGRDEIVVAGAEEFPGLGAVHVGPEPVDYETLYGMNPPAGGDHFAAWLNCGIYDQPQQNEYAVHSLEHGAVWVTYDPEVVTGADLDALRDAVPSTYVIVSPFEGLDAPITLSAWGAQVALDSADDERFDQFFSKYWKSPAAPEPGASCVGAIDGPGLVS